MGEIYLTNKKRTARRKHRTKTERFYSSRLSGFAYLYSNSKEVLIWHKRGGRHETGYRRIPLKHPSPVLNIRWRNSNNVHERCSFMSLATDHVVRIWSETGVNETLAFNVVAAIPSPDDSFNVAAAFLSTSSRIISNSTTSSADKNVSVDTYAYGHGHMPSSDKNNREANIVSHQELNVINSFENSKKKILEKLNILTLPNKSILNKVNNKSNTFHINEQNVAKLILANRLRNIYVLNHATSFTNKSTIDNLSNDFTPQLSSNLNLIIPTNQKSNKISRLRHFEIGYFQNSQLVAINFIIDIPLRCNFNSNHLSTSALYHIFPKSHKFKLQSNITSSLQTTDIENMKIGLMQPELQKCSNITSQKQKIISQFTNFRQPSSMVNIYWRIFEKSILVNNFAYKCSLKYLESFKDSLPLPIADQIEKKYQVFFKNILQNCKTSCRQTAKSNKRKFISPDSNKTVLTNNSQAGSPRYGTFFSQDFLFNFKYLDTCIDKMINPISSFFKKDNKSNHNILLFRKFQLLKNDIHIDNVETDEKKQQDNSSTASSITYNFDQTTFTESSETPNFVFTTSDSEPIYVSPRRKSHVKKKKISVGKHLVTYIDLITNEHQYSSEASYVSNSSESGPSSRHTSPIPSFKLNLSPDISFSNSTNETDSEPSNQISHSDSHDSVLE